MYGFLGPNGAGKTTTLRMALGLITPTEGTVELFGRDPLREGARALEGVAGFVESPRFYPYLSARKNLELLAALDGDGARERIDEVLEIVELSPRAEHRVGGYSHGMRQRLGIAAALLRRPRLLILDEPATGLDPAGMRDMRLLIRRLAERGDHRAAVEPPAPRGAGAVRPRGDRRLRTGRLRGRPRRPAPPGRGRLPPAHHRRRPRAGAAGPASRYRARERPASTASASRPRSATWARCRSPSRGRASAILALTPELATLEDLFFRLTDNDGAFSPGRTDPARASPGKPPLARRRNPRRRRSRSDEQHRGSLAGRRRAPHRQSAAPVDA